MDVFNEINRIKDYELQQLIKRLKEIGGKHEWDDESREFPYAIFIDDNANVVSMDVTKVELTENECDIIVWGTSMWDGCTKKYAYSEDLRVGGMTEILNFMPKPEDLDIPKPNFKEGDKCLVLYDFTVKEATVNYRRYDEENRVWLYNIIIEDYFDTCEGLTEEQLYMDWSEIISKAKSETL